MTKRKHDDSASGLQQPDATTTDRGQSMQPSATASSSVLKNQTSTSVAPLQLLEPSQSSGAADAAPQQPQAIMNQAYNGPTKRKKVTEHKTAALSVLNAEISSMKSIVSTLEAQNAAIKVEIAELKAENAELEAENAELETIDDKFKGNYIGLEGLNNSPRHRNAYLEAQNEKLKTQNIKLQTQCNRLQRDKLRAQHTKLHNKYAKLEAAYSDLEITLKQHKLRIQVSLMKRHINKLQDEALFEQDDHGEHTRATLKQAEKIVDNVEQSLNSYAKWKEPPPGNLLNAFDTSIKLSESLCKEALTHRSPKRSGAVMFSADTDLSGSGSGTHWPSDSAEASDNDDAGHINDTDDGDDTCDSGDTGDSGSCSDSDGSSMESSLDKPPAKKLKRNNDRR